MQNHQADSPLYVWPDVWSADLHLFIKKYGHTWHRMSLLRPDVIKQHKHAHLIDFYLTFELHLICWSASIKKGQVSCMIPNVLTEVKRHQAIFKPTLNSSSLHWPFILFHQTLPCSSILLLVVNQVMAHLHRDMAHPPGQGPPPQGYGAPPQGKMKLHYWCPDCPSCLAHLNRLAGQLGQSRPQ